MNIRTNLSQARLAFFNKHFTRTAEMLRTLPTNTDQDKAVFHFNMYLLQIARGNFEDARLNIKEALQLVPSLLEIIREEAVIYATPSDKESLSNEEIDLLLQGIDGTYDKPQHGRMADLTSPKEDPDILVRFSSSKTREELWVNEELFSRLLLIGRAYRLHLLSVVDFHEETTLNEQQITVFFEEIESIYFLIVDAYLREQLDSILTFLTTLKREKASLLIVPP